MEKSKEYTIEVTVKGTAALVQNRFPEEENGGTSEGHQPSGKDKPAGVRGKRYDDDVEAKKRLYLLEDGKTVYQPANHFESALIESAVNFKFDGKKTYKDAFKGGIFVLPERIRHTNQIWGKDKRSVVIQRARIMRVRPKFEDWELSFVIQCIDDRISPDVIRDVLDYAGLYKGIGDMRPRYGRFEVIKFEVCK